MFSICRKSSSHSAGRPPTGRDGRAAAHGRRTRDSARSAATLDFAPAGRAFFFPKGKCSRRSKRERARGIDAHCPTRSAKGPLDPHNRGASAEAQCGTAPRAARDLPARPVPRKTAGAPGMERPESIPLGSPPRTARRGMEPCSPVSPFFLDRGLWLGESTSRRLCGGVGGAFMLQEGQRASKPPTIFLWYRQAAPSLCSPLRAAQRGPLLIE